MKKNDFWFYSLICLFFIACVSGWNKINAVAVIMNSIIVIYQTIQEFRGEI
jgi:hypothetical protein